MQIKFASQLGIKESMKKKRLTLLALMTALLMVLSLTLFVACNNAEAPAATPEEETKIEATEGLLISNSDFKVVDTSSSTYPLSITDWKGASMYSSGSYPKGVIAGAISLEEALYSANASAWKDEDKTIYNLLKSHYSSAEGAVNNALMIYMPKKADIVDASKDDYGPTAYGYTSASFSLEANKYYKLSVDVLTYGIQGTLDDEGNQSASANPGARIYVSSNAYAEFANVNTNGEWKTYTLYIEGGAESATSLTVQLGLGKYTSEYTNGLTSGYAFFDNVNLVEIENTEYATASATELNGNASVTAAQFRENNQTLTVKVPNGRFDFGTTKVGTSATASNWSVVTDGNAPTGLGKNGIIDVSKFDENYSDYASTHYEKAGEGDATIKYPANYLTSNDFPNTIKNFGDNRIGTNVYMLSQQKMTANGLKSSKNIVVEKGKFYAISVSVLTYSVHGAGVTLKLSGEGKDILIKGIGANRTDDQFQDGYYGGTAVGTNGAWTTYTFYIAGNQYKNTSYAMSLWLGTGNTYDNSTVTYTEYESATKFNENQTTYKSNGTFATGWAFFDEVNLAEITEDAWTNVGALTDYEVDLESDSSARYAKVDLSTVNLFDGSAISANFQNVSDNAADYDNNTLGTPAGFSASSLLDEIGNDDTLPVVDVTAGVVSLAADANFTQYGVEHPGTPYAIESERALMFKSNAADSYFLFETDEFAVSKNGTYRISLWVKTVGIKSTSGVYIYLVDGEGNDKSSFTLINTSTYDDDDVETTTWKEYSFYVKGNELEAQNLSLRITYGTGNRWSSSTLANGVAFVSNISMTEIEYDDYADVSTGNTVKAVSLASSAASTSPSFTNGSFSNFNVSDTKWTDGNVAQGDLAKNNYAGVPSNWTINDSTYKPNGDDADDTNTYKETYKDDANLVAGIVKLDKQADNDNYYDASEQIKALFGDSVATSFNTLYGAEDDTYFENAERIGAPYVLAFAGLNGKKYTRSFASGTFSASANNNYKLSMWVKTLEATTFSIYLTGGSSGSIAENTNFVVKTVGSTDWTEYTFYIQVGLTSVSSLKLRLGIGYDQAISGDLGDVADEASSGIVLFDNVTLTTMTDDEFNALSLNNNVDRKITYLTDGFDTASDNVASRSELSTPSGWSGSADTEQSASDTKGGVIYADASALPKHDIDSADLEDDLYKDILSEMGQTVSLFGKTYKQSNYKIEQSDIDSAKATYPGKTDAEIETILQKREMYADMKANYISASDLLSMKDANGNDVSSVIGKNFLVINNTAPSSYLYTSNSYTLNAETFYKVSVYVRTFKATGAGASVEFYLGSANDSENPLVFEGIKAEGWTEYTFYVKTLDDKVTSATLKLQLGDYDADDETKLSSGYAMFDAITFETVTEEVYDNMKAQADAGTLASTVKVREVKPASQTGDTETKVDDTTETPEASSFNLVNLAWMIPSIIIAVATIAVVIVFFVKKYRKPAKDKVLAETNTEAITEKRDKYEDYNE